MVGGVSRLRARLRQLVLSLNPSGSWSRRKAGRLGCTVKAVVCKAQTEVGTVDDPNIEEPSYAIVRINIRRVRVSGYRKVLLHPASA
jgi:hypothetical protein